MFIIQDLNSDSFKSMEVLPIPSARPELVPEHGKHYFLALGNPTASASNTAPP